jgi:demethylmenaquinone methyltransferase/2-methoxy-6-polyprenyl-1,4-benzoquinol methylase/phosphoethanolamine N-methyltransferase
MNMLKRKDSNPETKGIVIHHMAWVYDLGCYLVGMGSRFRRKTLQFAQLQPGEHVLDVGCGSGVLTRLAAERVGNDGEVIGIDPSAEMIQVAKHKAAKVQSKAHFQLGVIESLPFEDERFDIVLSSMMLHHLPPELKVAGLREIFQVLKPGGRLMVVDIDKPTSLIGRVLMFPWRNDPAVKDNLEGHVPEFIQNAGFINVHHPRPKWHRFIAFWLATKPGK